MPRPAASPTARRSRRACRARGGSRVAAVGRADGPRAARGRRARPRACCCGPCGGWCRSGGSAAGTRRRSPCRRRRGSCGATPRSPPYGAGEQLVPGAEARPARGRPSRRVDVDSLRSQPGSTRPAASATASSRPAARRTSIEQASRRRPLAADARRSASAGSSARPARRSTQARPVLELDGRRPGPPRPGGSRPGARCRSGRSRPRP